MSANAVPLSSGAQPGATLSPLIQGVAQGQCHRIAVRAQFDGYHVAGLLTLQGASRCVLELAPGAYASHSQPLRVALYFQQRLRGPAVAVWLQGHWLNQAEPCLALECMGARPGFIQEHDRTDPGLTALAQSPVLFNRQGRVQLHYLNPLKGVFQVLDPALVMVPGIDVQLHFNCPWSGPAQVAVQVLGQFEEQGRTLCHFRVLNKASSNAIALMLLCQRQHFSFDSLPVSLRKSAAVDRLIKVAIVEHPRGLEDVLACRWAANRHYGRLGDVADSSSLWDEWDPHAIQVSARLGDKCVGAGRVVVNGGQRQRCEIQAATPLPEWLWAEGFVEMSRVAILPEYAGQRVMLALLRELGRITLHLQSRYIVLDAIEILVPIYTRLGARCLPISKKHPYSGESVRVMVFDIGRLLSALNVHLPQWLYVFGPTIEHSVQPQQVGALAEHFRVSATGVRIKRGLASGLKKIIG